MVEFDIELDGLDLYERRLLREIKSATERGLKKTVDKLVGDISDALNKSFKHAVDDFYEDPGFKAASYKRTKSLYKLLGQSVRFDEETSEIVGTYGFDPSKMTTFREPDDESHNGLYDQVFRKGWHGGADKVSDDKVKYPFQVHPEPGVPYYRYPRPYYRYWGKRAVILVPSPLERFNRYIDEAMAEIEENGSRLLESNISEEIAKIKI